MEIFLPTNYHEFTYFYGRKRVENRKNQQVLTYYVTRCTNKEEYRGSLQLLGSCENGDSQDGYFHINYSGKTTQIKILDTMCKKAIIYLYDPASYDDFLEDDYELETIEKYEFLYLGYLLQIDQNSDKFSPTKLLYHILDKFSSILSSILLPLTFIFFKTATYQHSLIWKKVLTERRRNGTIIFDIILGTTVCFLLYHINSPEDYFMGITEFVLEKLQILLNELAGSPVGLKLNVQLNNFLQKCFMYHVDLWWNFIIILEPAIHYLFIPITTFGLLGFSFQCALLCDIITIISLHAHCFYIYAAMLYKTELNSLRSLWRVVLGRRYNVLKKRVESQEYSNRQLFLATLFFTTLLFLLPTIIVYYVVFAVLRLSIYLITFILMKLQRLVLMLPLYTYIKWIFGCYRDHSNISFNLISYDIVDDVEIYKFEMEVLKSSPLKSSPYKKSFKDDFSQPLSIDKFTINLLYGDLMAFLPNGEAT